MKLTGIFNVKEKLFEEELISAPSVIWEYKDFNVDVHDRKRLLQIRTALAEAGDYTGAKIANKIILELDHYEKRVCLDALPAALQVEHSSYCNARCIMCSHAMTGNIDACNLREEENTKIKHLFPYVTEIILHGVGEPFLHPRIKEILDEYVKYEISVSGNTNGSVMNEELADTLGRNFANLSVSCDASSKEIYEKIRPGLNFETFIHNVRLLRSKVPLLHMRMAVVAMRQNLREMPDIVKMAADLGFDDVFITDVTTQSLLANEEDDISLYPEVAGYYLNQAVNAGKIYNIPVLIPEQLKKMAEEHVNAASRVLANHCDAFKDGSFYQRLTEQYRKLSPAATYIKADFDNLIRKSRYQCEGICDFILERPFIDAEGNVFLCCIDWLHCLGNLKENTFAEIWNGELLQAVREMFYKGWIPRYCVGCIFLRNQIMCKRIKVLNMDEEFLQHNFNEAVNEIIESQNMDKLK